MLITFHSTQHANTVNTQNDRHTDTHTYSVSFFNNSTIFSPVPSFLLWTKIGTYFNPKKRRENSLATLPEITTNSPFGHKMKPFSRYAPRVYAGLSQELEAESLSHRLGSDALHRRHTVLQKVVPAYLDSKNTHAPAYPNPCQ